MMWVCSIDRDHTVRVLDLHRRRDRHDVDGRAAGARGLAANRAVAPLVGLRRVTLARETHGVAMAGAVELERHDDLPLQLDLIDDWLRQRSMPPSVACRSMRDNSSLLNVAL